MKLISAVYAALFLHGAFAHGAEMPAHAQLAEYRQPSSCLQSLVDAPPPPAYFGGPRKRTVAVIERVSRPGIDGLQRPLARLAGLTVDTVYHAGAPAAYSSTLSLLDVANGKRRTVQGLPPASNIAHLEFSPDERWLALSVWEESQVKLWLVDGKTGLARRLLDHPLNSVVTTGFAWLAGSDALFVSLLPQARGMLPAGSAVPPAPVILESEAGKPMQIRNAADTMKSDHDADVLDWFMERQLAIVDMAGHVKPIGKPDRFLAALPSPDGKYILTSRLQRPYPPNAGLLQFPKLTEVRDIADGRVLRVLQDSGVSGGTSARDAVGSGPRDFGWRADVASTLYWVRALDDGNSAAEAVFRDGLYVLAPPFEQAGVLLARFKGRIGSIAWGSDDVAVLTETWWKQRERRTWRIRPGHPEAVPELMFSRDPEDRHKDPGRPLKRTLDNGESVLWIDEGADSLFFASDGASDEGDRPMLNRYRLSGGQSSTLWRSEPPFHERVLALLDTAGPRFITERQGRSEPPNLYVHTGTASPRALTNAADPIDWMKSVRVRELRYRRADGVALSGNLYLPPGYEPARDGRIPVLMWAYPRETQSRQAASQVRQSPYAYARIDPSSPQAMLCLGYAVLDNPSMPIVGDADRMPNDSHVSQLVASAQAAVDELVRSGVADPRRIAIGGHSYGAFMVANLLAHSDLFVAGIAESGAYSRSLTPFGFQSERRTMWQAPDVYQSMSPFNHADKIKAPLLLIHGRDDGNPGTMPMQSEMLFQALSSMGATVRLVTLPKEDHEYRARESLLHVLWEQERWLGRYLRQDGAAVEAMAPR
jgi:dipeptidyl aminopeptidase/acylaminoacyl peptidase